MEQSAPMVALVKINAEYLRISLRPPSLICLRSMVAFRCYSHGEAGNG